MAAYIKFEDEIIREIQGFTMTCKKCGDDGVKIISSFYFSQEEGTDGMTIEIECFNCGHSETMEED